MNKTKKRLNIEDVEEVFINAGYKLLSSCYINAKTKLLLECPKGHQTFISYGNFKAGRRCRFCRHNAPVTYDVVKKEFEKRGYKLLSKTYKNASTKLKYICPKGTEGDVGWNGFQRGHGCPCCIGRTKYNYDKVKKLFENRGAKLLSDCYINSRELLEYICSNGHKHSISLESWLAGHGCPECAGNVKNNIEDIRREFAARGYELLENNYINNKQKLRYRCDNGHVNSMSYGKFKFGRGCPTCAVINHTGPGSPSWKGGISYEPYCEVWKDTEYKQDIRERDGNRCLNPYCVSKKPNDLTIHHIDYNKKNCRPGNLITICRSCNSKANISREWHQHWYKAIIYRRYSL